jgi:Flp pilus assembly protein TadD
VINRLLPVLLATLLAVAAILQGLRGIRRLNANRALKTVEAVTLRVAALGSAGHGALAKNLLVLQRAQGDDPSNAALPLARGAQYLLLRRTAEAEAAYREALRLEPRAEVYLNLGRALWLSGQREPARSMFRSAVALCPRFESQLPAGLVTP